VRGSPAPTLPPPGSIRLEFNENTYDVPIGVLPPPGPVNELEEEFDVHFGYTGVGVPFDLEFIEEITNSRDSFHLFVILTSRSTGERYAARAGPDGGLGPLFSTLEADFGVFDESFPDKPSETVLTQFVGVIRGRTRSDIFRQSAAFVALVNASNIDYSISGINSNTFASDFVESFGLSPAPTFVPAPGFDLDLPISTTPDFGF